MEQTATLHKTTVKKHRTLHFYPKSLIAAVFVLVLCYVEYAYNTTYLDEGMTVFAIVMVVFYAGRLTQRDIITFFLLVAVVIIGLAGNLIFGINESVFSVLVDVVSQLKCPLAFYAVKYALNNKEKQQTLEMLLPIAKVYIAVNGVLAVVSQFVNLGMTGSVRYGLKSYMFLFGFTQQYATVTFTMIGVLICSGKLKPKEKRIFIALSAVAAIATLKSFSLFFTLIFIGLTIYYKKRNRITIGLVIPAILIMLLISQYQVDTYLTDTNSPRRMFIDYAVVDANQHFPLGSGFGTYGSAEAAKNYSPLYYEYGFANRWGMTPHDGKFLHDTYWPTVLGQFGWIGAALYITVLVRIFLTFNYTPLNSNRRAFLYAMFIQYIVHAVGSSILQSSAGFLGFITLGLCTIVDEEKENRHQRLKLHFRL